jgi:hypothetical protein
MCECVWVGVVSRSGLGWLGFFASTLLRLATCNCSRNIAPLFILWPQSSKLQSSECYLIAVAVMGSYRYCGRNCRRYLLPWVRVARAPFKWPGLMHVWPLWCLGTWKDQYSCPVWSLRSAANKQCRVDAMRCSRVYDYKLRVVGTVG